MAVTLTGSVYTEQSSTDPDTLTGITVPTCNACIVTINFTRNAGTVNELNWDNDTDFHFTQIVSRESGYDEVCAAFYMLSSHGSWPGAGTGKTLRWGFDGAITEGANICIFFVTGADTADFIGGTGSNDTGAGTELIATIDEAVAAGNLAIGDFSAYADFTIDVEIDGQTAIWESAIYNSQKCGVCYIDGDTTLRITSSGSTSMCGVAFEINAAAGGEVTFAASISVQSSTQAIDFDLSRLLSGTISFQSSTTNIDYQVLRLFTGAISNLTQTTAIDFELLRLLIGSISFQSALTSIDYDVSRLLSAIIAYQSLSSEIDLETGAVAIDQEGFRWRNDDGTEVTATWRQNQDIDDSIQAGQNIRLRFLLNASGNPDSKQFTLQYKKTSESAAYWKKVPVAEEQDMWTYGSIVPTTSGTTITLASDLPNGIREIEILINGVSTNTASQPPVVQLGDSGGFETTGYVSICRVTATTTGQTNYFQVFRAGDVTAAEALTGLMRLARWDDSLHLWLMTCLSTEGTQIGHATGHKTLSDSLTQIRFNTPGGSAIFDAGSARVRYR